MHATVHEWVQRFALDGRGAQRLWQLSGAHEQPAGLGHTLERGLALLAALLLGTGLIFWVAANWQDQTRAFKLGLLEGTVLLGALAALPFPRMRTAALLLATLALGALLAFVGQTYQTGADAWQLFATWAALALVWALVARSDGLWAVWLLIVGLAIALWSGDTLFNPLASLLNWRSSSRSWLTSLLWVAVVALPLALPRLGVPAPARIASRMAAAMALSAWVTIGIWGLFGLFRREQPELFGLSLVLAAGTLAVALARRPRDFVVLAMAVLALNVFAIAGFARLLFERSGSGVGEAMLLTLLAAACVGMSGAWLYRLQRSEGAAA
ncbi:MAG: DUF2157 domain-containing protein [Giesbergeria sp.]